MIEGCFVSGRSAAVEDTRACHEAGARADGDEVAERRVHDTQKFELGLQFSRACANPARNEQDVQRRIAAQGVGGHDALADCGMGHCGGHEVGGREGGDGIEVAGDKAECEWLRSREDVECVERTEDVEGLEAGEEEHTDAFGRLIFRHNGTLILFFFFFFFSFFLEISRSLVYRNRWVE